MKFNIRGSKIKVTNAIKDYAQEKIGKLNKYFDDPDNITANILVKVNGKDQIAEVTIITGKFILRGEESHKDLYAAIDLVSDKIERQIRKNKTRIKKRVNSDVDFNTNFKVEKDEEDKSKIVKRKLIEMKPMNEEEAILQMNLLDHEFFVFEDSNNNKISVLYKRKDGNYGILETK